MKRVAGAALALVLAASACSKTVQGGGQGGRLNSWTIPHTLRYTTGEDFNTLNPLLGSQLTMMMMSQLTMAWLIKSDAQDRPVPELLTVVPDQHNGGVSRDGLTITFHLRKGVRWSDGAPFTADDVIFSVKQVLNPANNVVSRSGWDRIKSMDEPDKYTVVMHLSKAYSPFVETFFSSIGANPSVLPKHLLDKYSNLNNVPYNSLPVGIGPFKYLRWDRGSRVVMVQNPLYFRGKPKLTRIVFDIIPDTNTILTQLQSKQIDLWFAVPGNDLKRVRGIPGVATLVQPEYEFYHIDFNLQSPKLKDPVVREAIRYATDRATIRDKVNAGLGVLQDQPAPNISAYWDPKIGRIPFDIRKANQMLDADGWKRGADGIRAKNGTKLVLDFVGFTGLPSADQMIELMRGTWKQIGIGVSVKHYLSSIMFAPQGDGGILNGGKFDVTMFTWGLGITGDLSNLYACDLFPPAGQNEMRWCDPAADKAMHDLYLRYDQSQRNADDAIVMERFVQDDPSFVMWGIQRGWAYNKDLKNFHPGAVSPFDQFMNVDI